MSSTSAKSWAVSLLCFALTQPAFPQAARGDLSTSATEAGWNYKPGATGGPEQWGVDYSGCNSTATNFQSPINMGYTTNSTQPYPVNLAPNYTSTTPAVVTSHFAASLDFTTTGATNTLTAGTTEAQITYNLIGIHAHSPSEHTWQGKGYDAELHLVHKYIAADGIAQFAVIAIALTTEGKGRNADIDEILKLQPGGAVASVNPASLLPAGFESNFYTYVGSLTTPPCNTGVVFYVLKTPQKISKDALGDLHSTVKSLSKLAMAPKGGYKYNSRPLQATEERVPFSMPPVPQSR